MGLTSPSTLAAGMAADNLVMAGYFAFIFSLNEKSIGDGHIEGKSEGMLIDIRIFFDSNSLSDRNIQLFEKIKRRKKKNSQAHSKGRRFESSDIQLMLLLLIPFCSENLELP